MIDLVYDVINNLQYLAGKYRDVPALILLPCTAILLPLTARRIGPHVRWLEVAALTVASSIILIMAGTSASYLANTGYLDHVESSVAAVSWWYHSGHPLYPAWNEGEGVYGLQYGPLLFQITAAALSVAGPSILISKLPGFCCFWLACFTVMWSLRPSLPSTRLPLLPVAALMIMAGCYWRAAYWVRSEPYLLLIAALALYSILRLGRTSAAIVLGLLGGCAIGLKIHGALYILPYAVAVLASCDSTAARARVSITGIASGIVAVVIPFLLPNVSLAHYIAFLGTTLQHGFARSLLILNLRFGGVLALPVLFLVWQRWRGEKQPDLPMGLTYLVSVAIVCVIGAKNGAGPTHLLPFLPAFVFFLVKAGHAVRVPGVSDARAPGLAVCMLVVAVAYTPGFAANLYGLQVYDRTVDDPAFRREATQLYRDYPSAVMGAAGDESYSLTEYKVLGIFAGGPLTLDPTTWMDLQKGVPDEVTQRLLIGCRSPFWIVPNGGSPFTQAAAYDPDPLFSDRFRELFHQNYGLVRRGEFYSVWACHQVPTDH